MRRFPLVAASRELSCSSPGRAGRRRTLVSHGRQRAGHFRHLYRRVLWPGGSRRRARAVPLGGGGPCRQHHAEPAPAARPVDDGGRRGAAGAGPAPPSAGVASRRGTGLHGGGLARQPQRPVPAVGEGHRGRPWATPGHELECPAHRRVRHPGLAGCPHAGLPGPPALGAAAVSRRERRVVLPRRADAVAAGLAAPDGLRPQELHRTLPDDAGLRPIPAAAGRAGGISARAPCRRGRAAGAGQPGHGRRHPRRHDGHVVAKDVTLHNPARDATPPPALTRHTAAAGQCRARQDDRPHPRRHAAGRLHHRGEPRGRASHRGQLPRLRGCPPARQGLGLPAGVAGQPAAEPAQDRGRAVGPEPARRGAAAAPGHRARDDEADRPAPPRRHGVDGARRAGHRHGGVLHLLGRPARVGLWRPPQPRRPGLCGLRPGGAGHGRGARPACPGRPRAVAEAADRDRAGAPDLSATVCAMHNVRIQRR
mmetsp:Transcript_23212/g.54892  ORF Transcript_23212/g.54892 Transcript_23212/m.54892 type:complete len:480 (+) Transcript_23212:568-2007(+)